MTRSSGGRFASLTLAISLAACGSVAAGDIDAGDDDTPDAATGPDAPPGGDFTIGNDTPFLLIEPGQQVFVQISITPVGGFTGDVDVTVENLPAGVTATSAVISASDGGGSITVTADASAVQAVASISYRGESGALVHTSGATLQVRGKPGELDLTWGTNGILDMPQIVALAAAGALEDDGQILVCGGGNGNLVVARFDADGSLDTTFGTVGLFTYDIAAAISCRDIIVQSDGHILVSFNEGATGPKLLQLTSAGQISSDVVAGGVVSLPVGGGVTNSTVTALLQVGGGAIVAVGDETTSGGGVLGVVWKLGANLQPVAAFGTGGRRLVTYSPRTARFRAVDILPDGDLIVAAQLTTNGNNDGMGLTRLDGVSGAIDTTFNSGASVKLDGAGFLVGDVAAVSGGNIVLYGSGAGDCQSVLYSGNGTAVGAPLVHSLGTAAGAERCTALFFDGSLNLVAVGQSGGGGFGWARSFDTPFQLDPMFGTAGTAAAPHPTAPPAELVDVLWLPDGRYLAIGNYDVAATGKVALLRIWH